MIDTKALRSRVLDLAIRGKLTEQFESDGTAEELYRQIQEEKKKLIKEGKIKKEKPLSAIKDEEIPFNIPESWKWVRLCEVFTLQAGKFISASQISDEADSEHQYECYGGNGVRGYVSDYNTTGTHALIGRQGALCGNINLAHDIFYATEHAVVVYQYCDVNVNWIYYGLTELNLNQYATSVAQPGLAVGKIEKVLIPLPPLAEQKRIVQRVEEIFKLLDTIDAAQEKYTADAESLKAKLITAGIQGKLTEQLDSDGTAEELYQQIQEEKQKLIKEGKIKKEKPLPAIKDEEIPFEIPGSWKWVRLKTVLLSASTGPFGSMLHKSDYAENGIPLINPADIINSTVSTQKIKKVAFQKATEMQNYRLNEGSIVIGRRGELGRAAIISSAEDGFLCGTGCFFVMPSYGLYAPFFIKLLQTSEIRERLRKGSVGSTMDNLNHSVLSKLPIPLPPLAEQKRIVEVLEKAMGAVDRL